MVLRCNACKIHTVFAAHNNLLLELETDEEGCIYILKRQDDSDYTVRIRSLEGFLIDGQKSIFMKSDELKLIRLGSSLITLP